MSEPIPVLFDTEQEAEEALHVLRDATSRPTAIRLLLERGVGLCAVIWLDTNKPLTGDELQQIINNKDL